MYLPHRTVGILFLGGWLIASSGFATSIVFGTASEPTGDFGGLSGGDAICQSEADAAGLVGTWVAWLSDGSTNAVDRIASATGPFNLVNGATIANNHADLTDGTIATEIDRKANGNWIDDEDVWTGTESNGLAVANHCNGWTSPSDQLQGLVGDTDSSSSDWTARFDQSCSGTGRLYCFQIPEPVPALPGAMRIVLALGLLALSAWMLQRRRQALLR